MSSLVMSMFIAVFLKLIVSKLGLQVMEWYNYNNRYEVMACYPSFFILPIMCSSIIDWAVFHMEYHSSGYTFCTGN